MNIMKRIRDKAIISLLAMMVVLSGSPLIANAAQDNATQKVTTQKAQTVSGSASVTTKEKKEKAKKVTLTEINSILSKMNPEDLAATLRLVRVSQMAKSKFVENVSTDTLMTGAIRGTVNALGDPYSMYMNPKMYKASMLDMMDDSFSGVGLEVGIEGRALTVFAPLEGSPAEKAGILGGDQILTIGSQDTKDLSVYGAVSKLRGPEGSEVVLSISRAGQQVKEYTLIRSKIQVKTVLGKMLENGMGYVRLSKFNENTGTDLSKKLEAMEKQGLKGLILDLRYNLGGSFEESIKVASHFVPTGPIVSVVTNDGTRKTSYSSSKAIKYPLVILVNRGTASASEMIAGAVQDAGTGTLVGTKTFGIGSVQTVFPLDDASAVRLTTAKYYTPNNRSIQGVGIEPDIKVEMPDFNANGKDLQLEKAIEVLKKKL